VNQSRLWRGDAQGSRPPPILTGRSYHTFHMGYYLLEYALIDDYLVAW
jgi:hypothetical protein